jgi:hypothetical protein
MQAWDERRAIRATVLRHLLVAGEWPTHVKGVQLRGVRIFGHLDLDGATLCCPLSLDWCDVDALCLDHATVPRISVTDCQVAGLTAELLNTKEVDLRASTFTGPIRIFGADIAGQLICRGAKLNGRDDSGQTLVADGLKVGDRVFLDKGFTAAGGISFRFAQIGASLHVMPDRLAEGDAEVALDATGARIVGALHWAPTAQVLGQVSLEGTSADELRDDWSDDRVNGFWPTGGLLSLDGFTYNRIGGHHQADVDQRLKWIRSQYPEATKGRRTVFTTQPYEQLVTVYRRAGQETQARKVAIARRTDLRQCGDLRQYRKVANWLLEKTIRYGYETWRAAIGLIVLFLAVAGLAWLAQHLNLIVPVGNVKPTPSATQCTTDYPCFYPAGYAIDTVIPLINVHQASYWGIDGSAGWGWIWVLGSWIATGLGWAGATLLVAGYTGLVRQE